MNSNGLGRSRKVWMLLINSCCLMFLLHLGDTESFLRETGKIRGLNSLLANHSSQNFTISVFGPLNIFVVYDIRGVEGRGEWNSGQQ